MKRNYKITLLVTLAMLSIVQGCNDILEEHPKTTFTNAYFETKQGLQDGLNAAYSYLRFQYGTNPALGLNVVGTDEFTFGPEPNYNSSGDNLPHKQLGQYTLSPSHGFLLVTYNRTFPIINLLNGLIEFQAQVSDITESERGSILAQVHYLRAHYYYFLVTQFGASPVDLGAGDFKFNRVPFTGFNSLDADLLEKNFQVMIDDLVLASQSPFLADARPAGQFKISKAVALHLLAKVYLFRGYSSVAQASDFQNAYNAAKELIDNQGRYGVALQQNFADAYKQGNDYNTEIIFAAERIPKNNLNNGYNNPSGIGDRENMAASCFTPNYEQPRIDPNAADPIEGRPFPFQRPLRKLTPTPWLLNVAFADKVNDSRYHGSFRTLWTVATASSPGTTEYEAFETAMAAVGRQIGDTAFYLADTQAQADALNARDPYYPVYGPDVWYTNQLYPTSTNALLLYPKLTKFDDVERAGTNDASGRPMQIFKFADTYLMAAEAAFQLGNATEAATLINVVRQRAAYRPERPGMDAAENAQANAVAATAMLIAPGDVTLDFILDERARELCGESLRWTDLAMRGEDVFVNRVKLNPDAQGVQAFHRRRPIPQQQLDAIDDPDKTKYQNPGY